ncbi:MAG: hypothetical protein WCP19_11480 [Chloroflexota bacterium]
MKIKVIYISLLAIFILSFLPGAALAKTQAKATQFVNVDVYNHSGSALTVLLTRKNTGGLSYLKLGTGVSSESLSAGMYDYSVSTPCGFETGTWNVTPGRILWISCRSGKLFIEMAKPGSSACSGKVGIGEIGIYGRQDYIFEFFSWSFIENSFPTIQAALSAFKQRSILETFYIGCWNPDSGATYNVP